MAKVPRKAWDPIDIPLRKICIVAMAWFLLVSGMVGFHKTGAAPAFGLVLFAVISVSMCAHAIAQAGKTLTSFENICLLEASRAEARHGIPKGLLQSITRVESGRKTVTGDFMPWAWTLNDRGEGLFFDDREAALAYLQKAVVDPDHSVDVGCMQINTKWHSEGFLELSDMLDPTQNADYAAGFLLDLHEAHQSWDDAVKHYHSAAPEKNVGYHRRVLAELERFMAAGMPSPSAGDTGADMSDADGPELALVTRPVTRPAPPALPAAAAAPPVSLPPMSPATDSAAVETAAPAPTAPLPASPDALAPAPQPFLDAQPNLAPHRARVEHFRRLLSRDPG